MSSISMFWSKSWLRSLSESSQFFSVRAVSRSAMSFSCSGETVKSVGKMFRKPFSFSSVPRTFSGFVFIHSKISARVPATSKSLDIFSVTF